MRRSTRARCRVYVTQKSKGHRVLRSLEKKGFLETEDITADRDPLRASAARLRVEFLDRADKLPKPERELLSFLELHPGTHNLAELEPLVAKASTAARSLARRKLVRLTVEPIRASSTPFRAPHRLNPHQQAAFAKST